MESQEIETVEGYRPRVVVKFHDQVDLPYQDHIETVIERLKVGSWGQLSSEFPGITLTRFYTEISPEKVRSLVEQATELDRNYQPPIC